MPWWKFTIYRNPCDNQLTLKFKKKLPNYKN